ncbi:MAG: threonine ammonia-lyase [Acidobacteriaceae bacterium]
MTQLVTLDDVRTAEQRLALYLHRTPLVHTQTLSEMTDTDLWLKAENLQKTGSFKSRGGINAATTVPSKAKARGVIAVSAGNHGAGLAYGARIAGIEATIVMPETAIQSKIAAIESYGARVVLVDGGALMEGMEQIRAKEGQTFIHPFDHPAIIAGQGTVGLEIVQRMSGVEVIVVPVGGGGLLSGVLTATKTMRPEVKVVGVEPEGSNVVSQSVQAGRPVRLDHFATVADGLNAPWSGPTSLEIIRALVDDVICVSDQQIVRAQMLILERTKLLVEPAGAAAVAALLEGLIPQTQGRRTVAILSGGNVDIRRLPELFAYVDN